MLLILGVWRHGVKKFRFSYDPLYWGLVFPLGMYSVCTYKMSLIFGVGPLLIISRIFLVAGIAAWFLTFMSLMIRPLYAALLMLRQRSAVLMRPGAVSVPVIVNKGEDHE